MIAYIDPGAGSLFIQALIGGLLAALYGIKVYWKKLKVGFQHVSARFKKPRR